MAISVAVATGGQGSDTTNAASYTTGSITFNAGKMYYIGVLVNRASFTPNTPTVSGATSGTWTNYGTRTFNTIASARSRTAGYFYKATSTFSETLTIDLAGSTHTNCAWICAEINHIKHSGTNGASGDASANPSITAPATGNQLTLGIIGNDLGSNPYSAGTFSLLAQESHAETASLAFVYKVGAAAAPDVTCASSDWGGNSTGWNLDWELVGAGTVTISGAAGMTYAAAGGGGGPLPLLFPSTRCGGL